MTARINPHATELLQRRYMRLRQRPAPKTKPRFMPSDEPNPPQQAALKAARDGGMLIRHRYGHWTNAASGNLTIGTKTIDACRRRGWLVDAPGFESAMRPCWIPVVITDAGLAALTKGE